MRIKNKSLAVAKIYTQLIIIASQPSSDLFDLIKLRFGLRNKESLAGVEIAILIETLFKDSMKMDDYISMYGYILYRDKI